jgi:hypothetical protein
MLWTEKDVKFSTYFIPGGQVAMTRWENRPRADTFWQQLGVGKL